MIKHVRCGGTGFMAYERRKRRGPIGVFSASKACDMVSRQSLSRVAEEIFWESILSQILSGYSKSLAAILYVAQELHVKVGRWSVEECTTGETLA